MIGELLLMALMIVIVVALWRIWVARARETRRADEAERSAAEVTARAEEAQRLAEGADGVAHDIANLLSGAFANLHDFEEDEDPAALDERMGIVSTALRSAGDMLDALRASVEARSRQTTTRGHVLFQAALLQHKARFRKTVTGDLDHGGKSVSAGRVVQNLLCNAADEAALAGGPVVVELTDHHLTVSNRVRTPESLTDDIYERGESGHGSSGVGLAVAVAEAALIGWTISHTVDGDTVTFEVRPE